MKLSWFLVPFPAELEKHLDELAEKLGKSREHTMLWVMQAGIEARKKEGIALLKILREKEKKNESRNAR